MNVTCKPYQIIYNKNMVFIDYKMSFIRNVKIFRIKLEVCYIYNASEKDYIAKKKK